MSQTKPTFNAETTSCAVPLPTGGCVTPVPTNKSPKRTPASRKATTPQSDTPYMQYTSNGVLVAR